jgi:hypothetical protein
MDKQLDEIFKHTIFCDNEDLKSKECLTQKQVYKAIKQLIVDEFEKIIGEDKPHNSFDEDYINGWNNSLEDLRQKISTYRRYDG